jgi:hypothetical protein
MNIAREKDDILDFVFHDVLEQRETRIRVGRPTVAIVAPLAVELEQLIERVFVCVEVRMSFDIFDRRRQPPSVAFGANTLEVTINFGTFALTSCCFESQSSRRCNWPG